MRTSITWALLLIGGCNLTANKSDDSDEESGAPESAVDDSEAPCEEPSGYADEDGDGYGDAARPLECDAAAVDNADDCDDSAASVTPGAEETPYNGVDDDCDDATPDDDLDGDGVLGSADCDDSDADVGPTQREIPYNGVDDDCDPETRDDDLDEDGHGQDEDCDESDDSVYEGALEDCADGVDQDCDGVSDGVGEACEDALGCSQTNGCSSEEVCVCACDDGSMLLWEISGVTNDSHDSPQLGASFTVANSSAGTSAALSCGDELDSLGGGFLPHSSGNTTLRFSFPCEEADGSLWQWYRNYADGRLDRRLTSAVWVDANGAELDRWYLWESLAISYSPSYPCTGGTVTVEIRGESFE